MQRKERKDGIQVYSSVSWRYVKHQCMADAMQGLVFYCELAFTHVHLIIHCTTLVNMIRSSLNGGLHEDRGGYDISSVMPFSRN